MPDKRMMRLGAFMRPVGIHTAWWRYPGAYPDARRVLAPTAARRDGGLSCRFAREHAFSRDSAWFGIARWRSTGKAIGP